MKKSLFIIAMCISVIGCPGGKRAPKTRLTFIDGNHICFSTNENDVLKYYTIYTSKAHQISIVTGSGYDYLNVSYPDTCINIKWENGQTYVIHYCLNDKEYVHQFDIDKNGKLINLGEQ
ncbi:putative T6SS immunity periplasmic lipoprotein [Enterobacter sp. UNJFSC 003]|uniref:putative T6SS immunity periplasmic lipoprotein n=1 Tax=Enterobacter sp. UNJFSC 003 TaxID=3122077 RepID=UPI002ECE6FA6|nr:hypothetical protein [Serratia liquefaciens]